MPHDGVTQSLHIMYAFLRVFREATSKQRFRKTFRGASATAEPNSAKVLELTCSTKLFLGSFDRCSFQFLAVNSRTFDIPPPERFRWRSAATEIERLFFKQNKTLRTSQWRDLSGLGKEQASIHETSSLNTCDHLCTSYRSWHKSYKWPTETNKQAPAGNNLERVKTHYSAHVVGRREIRKHILFCICGQRWFQLCMLDPWEVILHTPPCRRIHSMVQNKEKTLERVPD